LCCRDRGSSLSSSSSLFSLTLSIVWCELCASFACAGVGGPGAWSSASLLEVQNHFHSRTEGEKTLGVRDV
jgi:hypothetical protein